MKTTNPTPSAKAAGIFTFAAGLLLSHCGWAQTVGNSEFSDPPVGPAHYETAPGTSPSQPWTFEGLSGVADDGTAGFCTVSVADTNYPGQYAWIQRYGGVNASMFQTVNFNSTGRFALTFLEAGRHPTAPCAGTGAQGDLNYTVKITPSLGGASVLSVTNTSVSSEPFHLKTHQFLVATQGSYTISFSALSDSIPNDSNVVLIDAVAVSPVPLHLTIEVSQVRLCWNSVTNSMYQLQYQSEMTTNLWVNLGTPIQGNGTYNCVTDDVAGPRRFYRIEELP